MSVSCTATNSRVGPAAGTAWRGNRLALENPAQLRPGRPAEEREADAVGAEEQGGSVVRRRSLRGWEAGAPPARNTFSSV